MINLYKISVVATYLFISCQEETMAFSQEDTSSWRENNWKYKMGFGPGQKYTNIYFLEQAKREKL